MLPIQNEYGKHRTHIIYLGNNSYVLTGLVRIPLGRRLLGNFTLEGTRIKGICKHPTYRTRFQVIIMIVYTSVFQSSFYRLEISVFL
jgi:hypothetical protein